MNSEFIPKEPPAVLFRKLRQKALDLGIPEDELSNCHSLGLIKDSRKKAACWYKCASHLITVTAVLAAVFSVSMAIQWPMTRRQIVGWYFHYMDYDMDKELCIVELGEFTQDFARPPVNCDICKEMKAVDRVSNLPPATFEEKYAYSGIPVVITDAMNNWTAMEQFSFDFFKGIYHEDSPVLVNHESNCQFFPYKTNFKSLGDVFNMSKERSELQHGAEPWYIGWSNCDSSAANILREHYKRPYFLPEVSESSKTDWIFMGSPGYGAHLHIDNVGNPSWQAQIAGTKTWTLEPPPECYHVCENKIHVDMQPGDIFVLDTNIWYHSTLITGDNLSICIGSEFD